ncbi:hypothetical protein TWF281_009324 [Arthrobotrys megalospora]
MGMEDDLVLKLLELGLEGGVKTLKKMWDNGRAHEEAEGRRFLKACEEVPYAYFDFSDWAGETLERKIFSGYGGRTLKVWVGRSGSSAKLAEIPASTSYEARIVHQIYLDIQRRVPSSAENETGYRFEYGQFKGHDKDTGCVIA